MILSWAPAAFAVTLLGCCHSESAYDTGDVYHRTQTPSCLISDAPGNGNSLSAAMEYRDASVSIALIQQNSRSHSQASSEPERTWDDGHGDAEIPFSTGSMMAMRSNFGRTKLHDPALAANKNSKENQTSHTINYTNDFQVARKENVSKKTSSDNVDEMELALPSVSSDNQSRVTHDSSSVRRKQDSENLSRSLHYQDVNSWPHTQNQGTMLAGNNFSVTERDNGIKRVLLGSTRHSDIQGDVPNADSFHEVNPSAAPGTAAAPAGAQTRRGRGEGKTGGKNRGKGGTLGGSEITNGAGEEHTLRTHDDILGSFAAPRAPTEYVVNAPKHGFHRPAARNDHSQHAKDTPHVPWRRMIEAVVSLLEKPVKPLQLIEMGRMNPEVLFIIAVFWVIVLVLCCFMQECSKPQEEVAPVFPPPAHCEHPVSARPGRLSATFGRRESVLHNGRAGSEISGDSASCLSPDTASFLSRPEAAKVVPRLNPNPGGQGAPQSSTQAIVPRWQTNPFGHGSPQSEAQAKIPTLDLPCRLPEPQQFSIATPHVAVHSPILQTRDSPKFETHTYTRPSSGRWQEDAFIMGSPAGTGIQSTARQSTARPSNAWDRPSNSWYR